MILLRDVIPRQRSDEFHGLQSPVDLVGGGGGVPRYLGELVEGPVDLGIGFTTITGFSFVSHRTRMKSTHLLSRTDRSSACDQIPRINPTINRQSAITAAEGGGTN